MGIWRGKAMAFAATPQAAARARPPVVAALIVLRASAAWGFGAAKPWRLRLRRKPQLARALLSLPRLSSCNASAAWGFGAAKPWRLRLRRKPQLARALLSVAALIILQRERGVGIWRGKAMAFAVAPQAAARAGALLSLPRLSSCKRARRGDLARQSHGVCGYAASRSSRAPSCRCRAYRLARERGVGI